MIDGPAAMTGTSRLDPIYQRPYRADVVAAEERDSSTIDAGGMAGDARFAGVHTRNLSRCTPCRRLTVRAPHPRSSATMS